MIICKIIKRFEKELDKDELFKLTKIDEMDTDFNEEAVRKIVRATALGVGFGEIIFRALLIFITALIVNLHAGIIGVIVTDYIINRKVKKIDVKEVIRNMDV